MVTRTQSALRRGKMETTVSTLIDYFIATKRTEGLSDKTVAWYEWLLRKFAASLKDEHLASLALQDARDFVASLQSRQTRYEDHPRAPV